LEKYLKKAVVIKGAPSYASSVPRCNGTAEILNPKFNTIKHIPKIKICSYENHLLNSNMCKSLKLIHPVEKYTLLIPNNNRADEKQFKIKYFKPASVLFGE